MWWRGDVLTRHFGFGPLVVDGLTGQGVNSDLSDGHRGVLQLAVQPQDLGPFTGMLHHLEERKKNTHRQTVLDSPQSAMTLKR